MRVKTDSVYALPSSTIQGQENSTVHIKIHLIIIPTIILILGIPIQPRQSCNIIHLHSPIHKESMIAIKASILTNISHGRVAELSAFPSHGQPLLEENQEVVFLGPRLFRRDSRQRLGVFVWVIVASLVVTKVAQNFRVLFISEEQATGQKAELDLESRWKSMVLRQGRVRVKVQ